MNQPPENASPRRKGPKNPLLQGILVLDKPAGITSQQAVSRAKWLLQADRVGHGGTLDPFATGVLPLLLNGATRLAPLLLAGDKDYQGVARLGARTDTLDLTGKVLQEEPVPPFTIKQIEEAFAGFVGEIEQIPPMYSAVKMGGKRLYALARQQVEVTRAPKKIRIDSIDVLRVELPDVEFRVRCSGGTYVRTLVDDLGAKLGCGAHLAGLRRLRSGPFSIEKAVTLADLEEVIPRIDVSFIPSQREVLWMEALGESLLPVRDAVPGIPVVGLTDDGVRAALRGEGLRREQALGNLPTFKSGDSLVLLAPGGRGLAIGRAACGSDDLLRVPTRMTVFRVERLLS